MKPDGTYDKIDLRGKTRLSAQEYFCKEAIKKANKKAKKKDDRRTFEPISK